MVKQGELFAQRKASPMMNTYRRPDGSVASLPYLNDITTMKRKAMSTQVTVSWF